MSSSRNLRGNQALQHRSSARNRKGPDRLTILPNELILMIFDANKLQRGNTSTMATLCRVNKKFHAIAIELLYRKFSSVEQKKNSDKAIVKPYLFLRTVISRPDIANLVKEVSLKFDAGFGPVANPDPYVISEVFRLTGPRDYSLTIPYGVFSLRPTQLRNLFSFSVEHLLFRLPMIEKLELKTLGNVHVGPDRRWKAFARDGVRDNLQHLRHVAYESDDKLNGVTSQFLQGVSKTAPALEHLSLTAQLSNHETLQPFTIRSVRHLDLGSSVFSNEGFKDIIDACGSLISFKYMPNEYKMFYTEPTGAAILEALGRHRCTLVTLSLCWGRFRPRSFPEDSIPSVNGLKKLEHLVSLTIDIACLDEGEMLADVLPPRLQSLKLIRKDIDSMLVGNGSVVPLNEPDNSLIREHMLSLAVRCSRFPSLTTVTLLSYPALDAMSVDLIANAFKKKDVEFSTIEIHLYSRAEEIERLGGRRIQD